jgi:hypothetical protein
MLKSTAGRPRYLAIHNTPKTASDAPGAMSNEKVTPFTLPSQAATFGLSTNYYFFFGREG